MKIKALKGVQDILPAQIEQWNYVHEKAAQIFSIYGYQQIIIPIIEESRLFSRSIGQETDIVQKEMYTFLDRGNRSIALRPEATASVVRAYLEHNYNQQGLAKFFYSGAMFRGEKPQAGRNRQFYQIGIEALGSSSPYLDAEVINLAVEYLREISIKDFTLLINSVGSNEDKLNFSKKLKSFIKEKHTKLCHNCQNRYENNVLRVLDCKDKNCKKLLQDAPQIIDTLCEDSIQDFTILKKALEALKVPYTFAPYLVRGLDYYTKTVFEITHGKLGAQNTILAGGRYDNLINQLGGPQTGAAGFACGVERLLSVMDMGSSKIPPSAQVCVYAIGLGDEAYKKIFEISHELRKNQIITVMDFEQKSLKSQMRQANKLNCSHVLILGDDELKEQSILIKDMHEGKQEIVKLDAILTELKKRLGNKSP